MSFTHRKKTFAFEIKPPNLDVLCQLSQVWVTSIEVAKKALIQNLLLLQSQWKVPDGITDY